MIYSMIALLTFTTITLLIRQGARALRRRVIEMRAIRLEMRVIRLRFLLL